MPMPPYPVRCYRPECQQLAVFKIAARWSDGVTEELKTYSITCADCLAELFKQSRAKQAACRLTQGESLDPPSVYELVRGRLDQQLIRREDLERTLTGAPTSAPVDPPAPGS